MTTTLDQTNVFVKYLPAELDDDGLQELFAPFGDIISSKVMVDHQTKSSLGYGFVRFASPSEAQQAISKMSGHRIQNKVLLCKLSNPSPTVVIPEISTNLYIKPLLPTTTEESLRELFAEFGSIAAAKVMVDKATGESRQIGFNQDDATSALNAMNGHKLAENQPTLIVKYAETEQQRSARKARGQPAVSYSPPASPPPSGPTAYFYPGVPSTTMAMYSPISYFPLSISPYNHYMAMMPYPQSSFSPVWRPPYMVAAEQTMSY